MTKRKVSRNCHALYIVSLRKSCCVYFNPKNEQLWIIDYRIYDPDTDKKTKIVGKFYPQIYISVSLCWVWRAQAYPRELWEL